LFSLREIKPGQIAVFFPAGNRIRRAQMRIRGFGFVSPYPHLFSLREIEYAAPKCEYGGSDLFPRIRSFFPCGKSNTPRPNANTGFQICFLVSASYFPKGEKKRQNRISSENSQLFLAIYNCFWRFTIVSDDLQSFLAIYNRFWRFTIVSGSL
jgi:hypothetical protein